MKNQSTKLLSYSISIIQRTGRRLHAGLFQLSFLPAIQPSSRFAVIAGIKVNKHAVVRNRAKRLLRESMRHQIPNLSKPIDAVLVARKADWKNLRQQDVETELRQVFARQSMLS